MFLKAMGPMKVTTKYANIEGATQVATLSHGVALHAARQLETRFDALRGYL